MPNTSDWDSDWQEVQDQIVPYIRVTKRIWDVHTDSFCQVKFVRIERTYHTRSQMKEYIEDLTRTYGPDQYLGQWWTDGNNNIWLREEAATFFLLKHGIGS